MNRARILDLMIRCIMLGTSSATFEEGQIAFNVLNDVMQNKENLLDISDIEGAKKLLQMVEEKIKQNESPRSL